jgi:hypothetical protein
MATPVLPPELWAYLLNSGNLKLNTQVSALARENRALLRDICEIDAKFGPRSGRMNLDGPQYEGLKFEAPVPDRVCPTFVDKLPPGWAAAASAEPAAKRVC